MDLCRGHGFLLSPRSRWLDPASNCDRRRDRRNDEALTSGRGAVGFAHAGRGASLPAISMAICTRLSAARMSLIEFDPKDAIRQNEGAVL